MAQAKRIKGKPAKKKTQKGNTGATLRSLPWGLLSVVLIAGFVVLLIVHGARMGSNGFGAGLKELIKQSHQELETDQEISELIKTKSSKIEFEFYELLPDIDKVMPDDLPEAMPTRNKVNYDYYLQAASFRERADAERLRVRLALKGYSSETQGRQVPGKGTYYRVRLGPFSDKRKAKAIKNKLQKLGVRPFIYGAKKP